MSTEVLTGTLGLLGTILSAVIGAVASIAIAARGARAAAATAPASPAWPMSPQFPPGMAPHPGAPQWTAPAAVAPTGISPTVIMGGIGLIAWCLPIVGLPLALVSLGIGISDMHRGRNKQLTRTGMYLSLLSLVAATANCAIGAYMGATNQF